MKGKTNRKNGGQIRKQWNNTNFYWRIKLKINKTLIKVWRKKNKNLKNKNQNKKIIYDKLKLND